MREKIVVLLQLRFTGVQEKNRRVEQKSRQNIQMGSMLVFAKMWL
jgi:hypothetical protein